MCVCRRHRRCSYYCWCCVRDRASGRGGDGSGGDGSFVEGGVVIKIMNGAEFLLF